MTDAAILPVVISGLVVAHIWQSVALAAVLAAALIFGRKLSGANRYSLAVAAFLACLILPAASLLPGESLARAALTWTKAPISIREPDAMIVEQQAQEAAEATASASAPAQALGVVQMGTDIARSAIESSTPGSADSGVALWALDVGARMAEAGLGGGSSPTPADVAAPAPEPLFALPRIDLTHLPDLTLPLLLAWLAGALVMLARTGRDLIAVERLVARATTIELPPSLKQRMKGVRVAISPDAPGPMAAGLLRPCVVLPESATAQLNSPGMAALLEHERAHIERRDMAVALAQRVVLALLWWSPALHWISRRIDEERELACDETAVERTGDARAFARSLTTQAENQLWARAPRLAVGAIGPRSQFGRRIRRLIDLAKSGGSTSRYSGRLAFSGLALVAVLAAVVTPRIIAQSPENPPSQQDSEEAAASLAGDDRAWRLARFSPQEPPAPPASPAPPSPLSPLSPVAPAPPLPPEFEAEMDALGVELELLMQEVASELEGAAIDMQPALDAELAGLGAELAGLGAEIAATVAAELAMEMPGVMADVRLALADVDWNAHADEVRDALDEARAEFGPEFREELRQSLEEAREEMAAHRDEIAAALVEKRASMAEARNALAMARAELADARARSEFDGDHADVAREDMARELADADRGVVATKRLTAAAAEGDLGEIRRLLAEGVDPDRYVTGQGTPLGAAVRAGELAAVRTLVEAGADVNRVYVMGRGERTALAEAIAHDETAIANYLRGHGAIAEPHDSN